MVIFANEEEFLSILGRYDKLARDCAKGEISFNQFLEQYDSFPEFYALDGHESDDEENQILDKYDSRVQAHLKLSEKVLSPMCSEEDSVKALYIQAGRIGSREAFARLQEVVRDFF